MPDIDINALIDALKLVKEALQTVTELFKLKTALKRSSQWRIRCSSTKHRRR